MADAPESLKRSLGGRYELEEPIGRGGMATVYRARDVKHGRRVAVKVLRSDLGELIGPERFLREIEIAARLTHPNILPLYDSGDADGQLYYVMPYVEGESLRGLLSRVGLMDTEGAVEIVRRVADALDYAHTQGIVHRDIKPENILLPGGQPVVADFGIAKAVSGANVAGGLTRTGIALGTPGYMSPEQAAGLLELGEATDVYSLGVVAYEMLVGGLPRAWVTPDVLAAGRLHEAAPDHRAQLDRLPAGMERALVRALALRPEERFASPGELAGALAHPETLAGPARPVPVPLTATAPPVTPHPTGTPAAAPVTGQATVIPPTLNGGFLGAPTRLMVERVVEGEVRPEEFDALLEEVRVAFRAVGYTSRTDRSFIWTGRRPQEPGQGFNWEEMFSGDDEVPDALVRVSTRHGQTRIQVEQRVGGYAGGLYGGLWGGGGGGGLGVVLGVGIGALGLPLGIVFTGAAGWVGATYLLSRGIYRAIARSRLHTLERLADRLAEQCEEMLT
jgi:tRNA A-37 threonylcarbamoyl transferase component Bud32